MRRTCLVLLAVLIVGCGAESTPTIAPPATRDVVATVVASHRMTTTAEAARMPTVTATNTPTPTATATPTDTPTPTPPPAAQLEGQVLDEGSSQPLAGAQVAAGERQTTTDSEGRFLLTDLAPGQYTVLVTSADHDPVLSGIVDLRAGEQVVVDAALPAAGTGDYPRDPMASHQIDPAGAPTAQDAERLARLQGLEGEVVSVREVLLEGEYLVNYRKGDAIRAAMATLNHPAWELVDEAGQAWYIVRVCGNLAVVRAPQVEVPAQCVSQPNPVVTVGGGGAVGRACPDEGCDAVVELSAGWHGVALGCSQNCTWLQVNGPGVSGECWVRADGVESLGALEALPEVAGEVMGKIAFYSNRDREPAWADIYVMNPDGSEQTRITVGLEVYAWMNQQDTAGAAGRLDWSPAHERFFYTPQGPGSRLYSLDVNGGNQIPLTDKVILQFDLSPDGRQVAYLVPKTILEIAVAELDGSNEKILTNETMRASLGIRTDSSLLGPAWSPDGQRIAFYSAANGNVSTIRPDGSDPVRLSEDIGVRGALKMDWSPDGRYVAFAILNWQASRFDLGTLEVGASQAKTLVEDGYAPAWSPDSSQIVFQRSDGQIWIVKADGTGLTQLTFKGRNCCAVWLP